MIPLLKEVTVMAMVTAMDMQKLRKRDRGGIKEKIIK